MLGDSLVHEGFSSRLGVVWSVGGSLVGRGTQGAARAQSADPVTLILSGFRNNPPKPRDRLMKNTDFGQ